MDVLKFDSENEKVPQIGWNNIYDLDSKIFSETNENDFIYMVHSYYVPLSKFTIAKLNMESNILRLLKKIIFMELNFILKKVIKKVKVLLKKF